jgi:transcription initiation factor TFIID subunit 1, fungi type
VGRLTIPLLLKEREKTDVSVSLPLHDRSFDLILLSNWEDQIIVEPEKGPTQPVHLENSLTTPANKSIESGAWTRSIIWGPHAPFRDFTKIEFNHEDDVIPEDRTPGTVSGFPSK